MASLIFGAKRRGERHENADVNGDAGAMIPKHDTTARRNLHETFSGNIAMVHIYIKIADLILEIER